MGCEHSKDFDALTSFARLKPYRWSIDHFNRARKLMAKGQFIESPPFTRGSAVFNLKFYPNGAQGTAEGTTSLFLCLSKVLLPALPALARPPTQYVHFEYCPTTRVATAVAMPTTFPSNYFRAPLSQPQLSQLSVPLALPLPSAPIHPAQSLPQLSSQPQAQSQSILPSFSSLASSPSIRVRVCATLDFDNFSRFTVMPITQFLTPLKSANNAVNQSSPSSLGWSEYSTNYLSDKFVIEVDVQSFEDCVKTYVSAIPF